MATIESALGEWKYQIEHQRGMGRRINWRNAPPPGTELLATFDEPVVVDGIGMAGMVVCTRKSDGHQIVVFPSDLKVPSVPGGTGRTDA